MKKLILMVTSIILLCGNNYSQTSERLYNLEYMQTVLHEDFTGSTLNSNVWRAMSHFKRKLGFLVDDTATIGIENGKLELKMKYTPNYLDSMWRTDGWEHVYSDYVGGEIWSQQKFQYGIFECSAKYAHQSGSWPAFWLYGNDGAPCPPGGYGSEIDIAEYKCKYPEPEMLHLIHRYYPPDNCDESKQKEEGKEEYQLSLLDDYITYKCIWTPEKIQYYINDNLEHEVENDNYDWFPALPLHLILSQQVLQPYNIIGQAISPIAPQTSLFDWVKVKQFFLAPEITCPDNFCTSTTATLDVDSDASNVTWSVTPSNLVTASSGTGLTANLTAASNASGEATISFSFQMPSGETFSKSKNIWVGSIPPQISPAIDPVIHAYTADLITNKTYEFEAFTDNPSTNPFDYQWVIETPEGSDVPWTLETGKTISYSAPVVGQYTFKLKENGTCGFSEQTVKTFYFEEGGLYMAITPNPATGHANVELKRKDGKAITEDIEWDLEVYDQAQLLKTKTQKLRNKQQTLNVQGWQKGIYVVCAIINGEVITEKLIVQ